MKTKTLFAFLISIFVSSFTVQADEPAFEVATQVSLTEAVRGASLVYNVNSKHSFGFRTLLESYVEHPDSNTVSFIPYWRFKFSETKTYVYSETLLISNLYKTSMGPKLGSGLGQNFGVNYQLDKNFGFGFQGGLSISHQESFYGQEDLYRLSPTFSLTAQITL